MSDREVEIEAKFVHETDLAWLIDDGNQQVWIPKSQCTDNEDGTYTVPEWLALQKGLI